VDVKRVLLSASWDDEDALRETIHRLPNIDHRVTTLGLGYLSFLVENAVLSIYFCEEGNYLTRSSWYPSATSYTPTCSLP